MASGRGSNLAALLDSIKKGRLSAEITVVISNNAQAGALETARKSKIPAYHLTNENYNSQEDFDQAFLAILKKHRVELIALAGYLKKISSAIIQEYRHRIVNIHPALLPSFGGKGMYGMKVHEAVLEYGCRVTGVTVHIVDEKYDTGPPVLQRCVEVEQDDKPETLAARVLKVEHTIYSEALQLFAEDRIRVDGRNVKIAPSQVGN